MVLKRMVLLILLLTVSVPAAAQQAPFSRGVNPTNWFQADSAAEIPFNRYTRPTSFIISRCMR